MTNSERTVVAAMEEALADEKVMEAVAAYKNNRFITGHKVLDDAEGLRALIRTIPGRLRLIIDIPEITTYRRTQLLNHALRRQVKRIKP